ncbi:hypothetical protein GX51_08004 [Blastomyces parvus]|uniref:Uncharacterized protein n=1 Tax=Blastomyces parvus TaxID=2060905 RepID=A0A2B7WHM0_9EURO|nr:hypothetical protein GX51_08004 [Blastomyces parvus]
MQDTIFAPALLTSSKAWPNLNESSFELRKREMESMKSKPEGDSGLVCYNDWGRLAVVRQGLRLGPSRHIGHPEGQGISGPKGLSSADYSIAECNFRKQGNVHQMHQHMTMKLLHHHEENNCRYTNFLLDMVEKFLVLPS